MAGNVQCPVCTLFLLPGMDLSDHLETHPKEQVIKALVQMSLKSEVTETVTPDTPKKVSSTPSIENEVHARTNEDERATPMSVASESTVGVNEKQRELEDNINLAPIPQSISLNRQCGYLFENNSSSSSSSSSSNFFGPPTPYYHQHHQHHQHQQQQQQQQLQQQQQQQQQSQQQQQQHNLQNYHSYNGHPGQSQPPMRLFSYQPNPKPLQPPPAYGAAISQLRSQNSQNLMVSHINRPQYSPGNHSSISSPSTSSLSVVSSRQPPPLPPPPLNLRFQTSFPPMETPPFTDPCDSNAMSPRRSSMTPPIRPPPQLYRSPLLSAGQYSRQSSSPYSVMTGSPSVLRFAESPVTAHYLERENGDFIVQETPKHVVECVEKDDGEFSVIERVYHMPPSVVQINEDQDDDLSSDHGSNSEDMKLMEDDLPGGTWSGARSPEQGQTASQKKSGITVLSDVQLDLNEYLDLMGNIIASSKVAKSRTEMIKIEKFEPEEVKEEMSGTICLDNDDEDNENDISMESEQKQEETKEEQQQYNDESSCYPVPLAMACSSGCVTPASSMTSVIRLATNPSARSTTPSTIIMQVDEKSTKVEDAAPSTSSDMQITKVEEPVTTSDAVPMEAANDSTTNNVEEATSTDTPVAKVEEAIDSQSQITTEKPETQMPEKPPKPERQSKKEGKSPVLPYYQSVRRPIKKTTKKLVIKPRSKDPAPSAPIQMQIEQPSTSKDAPSVDHQKEEEEVPAKVCETTQDNELNSIKTESVAVTTSDSIPPPLFADADEKLPPDDELLPCTSHSIATEEDAASAAFSNSTLEDKPTADLTAFLDQCMKKEEEAEDHPMHSIFGAECVPEEPEALNDAIPSPASPPVFPSASLFSKPLTASPEQQLTASDSVLLDSSDVHEHDPPPPQQKQTQPQATSSYVEYPFSFLYGGAEANHQDENKHNISPPIYCSEDFNKYSASTSGGNSASCTWYQSQSSENDFEMDGKGSYLDLDSCKRSASFAAATEGSMPTTDTLNIRTDEKMPAKGEISEQESNCGVENSWSQPLYNEFPVRFPIPYQNFMTTQESWSHDNYFRPQDLSSSVETKNFSLRLTEESPIMDTLPSTSKRKNKAVAKLPRKKTFQCAHCNTHFPLLKEKNAHLIKQHGYKRVNRRLIRDPPTSTVTTATMSTDAGASLLLGLEPSVLPPPLAEEDDSKAAIVKIEQENKELKDCKKSISNLALTSNTVTTTANANVSRTKYDSMRARDNRMLINFNLNALNVKNEGKAEVETHSFYQESKSAFFCFVCRRDFLTVKLFDEHLVEHPAECFTCHKTFTRWKNFMVHLKRHLGWKDFGCTICEKKFVIRSALVEHMRMHTGHTPLKCKICGKSFKRYSNLTQHRKRHGNRVNRTKEYVCYCGEVLPSKARFIWHKETHDLKPKCCPYCRDRFVHANSLRRHIRLAHSDKFDYTEPMECPMCKQIYAKSSIKAHMATHSMDTQHECLICNKSFSTKWNLKIHNWVHANRTTKPFKCDQCVKAFVREVDYNNHMNSHKQIKPYTCEHCGCKFIRKYNYIRHRREHHGNKKFTCDLCGKLFHRHYYLIEHRRIHTGERPFQCTICGKSSTTKTNHNKHLKIHHSRDPFTSEA